MEWTLWVAWPPLPLLPLLQNSLLCLCACDPGKEYGLTLTRPSNPFLFGQVLSFLAPLQLGGGHFTQHRLVKHKESVWELHLTLHFLPLHTR